MQVALSRELMLRLLIIFLYSEACGWLVAACLRLDPVSLSESMVACTDIAPNHCQLVQRERIDRLEAGDPWRKLENG